MLLAAGDGNCLYRSIGLAMVVAAAALPASLQANFKEHLSDVNSRMEHSLRHVRQEQLSEASAAYGYEVLLVSSLAMSRLFYYCCYALLIERPGGLLCNSPAH